MFRRFPGCTIGARGLLGNRFTSPKQALGFGFRAAGWTQPKSFATISKIPVPEQEKRRKVLVIYSGGTMGMVPTVGEGLRPKSGYLTEQILLMEELESPIMPEVNVLE
jgi:L-asparaginase/Glu-tRNA(Gln) amidotransferase subunit D